MYTLLLRLSAPLQSWGCESNFSERRTCREPTKSGIIGLLAAALGRHRDEPIDDLCKLRIGIRVDREGSILCDLQSGLEMDDVWNKKSKKWKTEEELIKAKNSKKDKGSYLTNRYYLEDAVFLVGIELEDRDFLEVIRKALLRPAFPLYLGRRSCPPTQPLALGIRQAGLLEALRTEPIQLSDYEKKRNVPASSLKIITDADIDDPEALRKRDLPLSFSQARRQFTYRPVKIHRTDTPGVLAPESRMHDAMAEL